MGFCVCGGAQLLCTFGAAPSVFNVLPANKVTTTMPIANIMDNKPMVNIMPFGVCMATFPPLPCTPATAAPWAPGSPTVLIANQPALNNMSKLMCSKGGVIQILNPGTTNINVP